MSGKLITGAIAVSALAVMMGVTNPKPESYHDYASERMLRQNAQAICSLVPFCDKNEIPDIMKNTVKNTVLKPAISASTKRQNLGLLSIYTTEIPGSSKMQTLAMFGNFFTYSQT